jgi:AcrR family transcriptional regulator
MAVRVTRAERREQIRADLLAAARQVFLRRGFHQASLEEIALEAGWSKGAVFSNFAGKDDLFLAVLDTQNRRRRREQLAEMRAAPTLAEALTAAVAHALIAIGALPPIRVDVVAEIPRETGPGAKLKTVVVRPR